MEKQQLYQRARADYQTGYYSWYDLKRRYPQLTTNEIFIEVIGVVRCSTKAKNQGRATEKPS